MKAKIILFAFLFVMGNILFMPSMVAQDDPLGDIEFYYLFNSSKDGKAPVITIYEVRNDTLKKVGDLVQLTSLKKNNYKISLRIQEEPGMHKFRVQFGNDVFAKVSIVIIPGTILPVQIIPQMNESSSDSAKDLVVAKLTLKLAIEKPIYLMKDEEIQNRWEMLFKLYLGINPY